MDASYTQTNLEHSATTRASISSEFEEVCKDFHALLDSLSDVDLQRPSANPAWTVKELLMHVVYWQGYIPLIVAMIRRGISVSKFPRPVFHWINKWLTRLISRGKDRHAIANEFDRSYRAARELIDGIRDDEWSKGITIFMLDERCTIELLLRRQCAHFREHAAEIKASFA